MKSNELFSHLPFYDGKDACGAKMSIATPGGHSCEFLNGEDMLLIAGLITANICRQVTNECIAISSLFVFCWAC